LTADTRKHIAAAKDLWEERSNALGPDDPETLEAVQALGNAYRAAKKYQQAQELFERLLEIRTRLAGPNDHKVQQVAGLLASVLFAMGHFTAARELQERSLAVFDEMYGIDAPISDIVAGQLQQTLSAMKEFGALRDLEERILATRRQRLGVDHLDTLRAQTSLAETLRALGDFQAAKVLDLGVVDLASQHHEDLRVVLAAELNLLRDMVNLDETEQTVAIFEKMADQAAQLPPEDAMRKEIEKRCRRADLVFRAVPGGKKFRTPT
jgi:tetratricopeptide (TPR) repeat protein